MRIGIDASNLRAGGGVTHLREILQVAKPDQHEFAAITVWGPNETLDKLPVDRKWLHLVSDPMLNGSTRTRLQWRRNRLPKLAVAASDLLFAPGGLLPRTALPTVTMCRNMVPFSPKEKRRFGMGRNRLKFELIRIGQAASFRRANGVIFLSQFAHDAVRKTVNLDRKPVTIIPHGIARRFFCPPRPERLATSLSTHRPIRLLYVSTVHVYKHQWQVVKAVARLRANGLPVKLELIGRGYEPGLTRLREAIDLVDPTDEFTSYSGAVPFEELHQRYQRADIFVYASSCENLPNILLEAMAAGLPVASSRCGPMPEILGEFGEYFDPEDPASIADAVKRLLQDDERRASLAEGAYSQAETYTWERCADATFDFLRQVLSLTR